MNDLAEKLTTGIEGVTEGLVLRVAHRGEVISKIAVGKTYPYYDLASLTKILFAIPATMHAVEEGQLAIESPVQDVLPWFPHREVTVFQLLTHSSGLSWWQPFYKDIDIQQDRERRWEQLSEAIVQLKLENRNKAIYSDVGILTLGFVLEAVYEKPLLDIWQGLKQRQERDELHFHPNHIPLHSVSEYAPTEDCKLRGKVIQGEVHDENTWYLGGVAPHAGLFGSANEVISAALQLRRMFNGEDGYLKAETVQKFTQRQIPVEVGDWGLGFMKPTKGKASCGHLFSENSFGHTGFTGTSLWHDPERDLTVVILSNRTYPTRENQQFVKLRPQIHDWVVEELGL